MAATAESETASGVESDAKSPPTDTTATTKTKGKSGGKEEEFAEEEKAELAEMQAMSKAEGKFYQKRGADVKFVGLLNQGATCYLNSLIQTLFMTPEIRAAIMQWKYAPPPPFNEQPEFLAFSSDSTIIKPISDADADSVDPSAKLSPAASATSATDADGSTVAAVASDASPSDGGSSSSPSKPESLIEKRKYDAPPEYCITYQLQCLFARLTLSQQSFVSTKALTKSFHWDSGEQRQQHDVQEFLKSLFDAIQRSGKPGDDLSSLDSHWQGHLIDFLKCLQCGRSRSRLDPFTDLNLVISEKRTLSQALQAFLTPELMNEGNQVWCDHCGCKCDFEKGLKLDSRLPNILFIQMKRFYYDWAKDRRVKLRHKLTFPFTLNMEPFVTESPSETTTSESTTTTTTKSTKKESDLSLLYDLYGVIIQSGGAMGGHYWALIKSWDNGLWYKFNDSLVKKIGKEGDKMFDYEFLSAFGGEKMKGTGYVLVYRKKDHPMPKDFGYCHPHFQSIVDKEDLEARQRQAAFEKEMRTVTLNVFTHKQRPKKFSDVISGEDTLKRISVKIKVDTGEVNYQQLHQQCVQCFIDESQRCGINSTGQGLMKMKTDDESGKSVPSSTVSSYTLPPEADDDDTKEPPVFSSASAATDTDTDLLSSEEVEKLAAEIAAQNAELVKPEGTFDLKTTRVRMYRPDHDFLSGVLVGDPMTDTEEHLTELVQTAGLNRYHCNLFVERMPSEELESSSSSLESENPWPKVDPSIILVRVCVVSKSQVLSIIDSDLGSRYSSSSKTEGMANSGLVDELTIVNILVSDEVSLRQAKMDIYRQLLRLGKIASLNEDEWLVPSDITDDESKLPDEFNIVSLTYSKCRVLEETKTQRMAKPSESDTIDWDAEVEYEDVVSDKSLKDSGVTLGDLIYFERAMSDEEVASFEVITETAEEEKDESSSEKKKDESQVIGSIVCVRSRLARVYEEQKMKATLIYNAPLPITQASELMRQLVLARGKSTLDMLKSTMRARVEYNHHVRVSLNATMLQVKQHICKELGLPGLDHFRLRKGKNLPQYMDLKNRSVQSEGLNDGNMLYVESGPPCQSSDEMMISFTLYDPKKQWTDPWKKKKTLWPKLFECVFNRHILVSKFKEEISDKISQLFPAFTNDDFGWEDIINDNNHEDSVVSPSDSGSEATGLSDLNEAVMPPSDVGTPSMASSCVSDDLTVPSPMTPLIMKPNTLKKEPKYSLIQAVAEMKRRMELEKENKQPQSDTGLKKKTTSKKKSATTKKTDSTTLKKKKKKVTPNAKNAFDCVYWRVRKVNGARIKEMLFDNLPLGTALHTRGDCEVAIERTIMKERFTKQSLMFKLHRYAANEGTTLYGRVYNPIELIVDKNETIGDLRRRIFDFYSPKKAFKDTLKLENISIVKGFSESSMTSQMVHRLNWPHLESTWQAQAAQEEKFRLAMMELDREEQEGHPEEVMDPSQIPSVKVDDTTAEGESVDDKITKKGGLIDGETVEDGQKKAVDSGADVSDVTADAPTEEASVKSESAKTKSDSETGTQETADGGTVEESDSGETGEDGTKKKKKDRSPEELLALQQSVLAEMDSQVLGQPPFHLRNGQVLVWCDISQSPTEERLAELQREKEERQKKLKDRLGKGGSYGTGSGGGSKRSKRREGPALQIRTHQEWEEEQFMQMQIKQIEEMERKAAKEAEMAAQKALSESDKGEGTVKTSGETPALESTTTTTTTTSETS